MLVWSGLPSGSAMGFAPLAMVGWPEVLPGYAQETVVPLGSVLELAKLVPGSLTVRGSAAGWEKKLASFVGLEVLVWETLVANTQRADAAVVDWVQKELTTFAVPGLRLGWAKEFAAGAGLVLASSEADLARSCP